MISVTPLLACHGISKRFERRVVSGLGMQERLLRIGGAKIGRQTWSIDAVRDVSLSVERGEWVGIYGPNGSGKTTLLKMLAGVLPPDSGTIERSCDISSFFGLGVGFHAERTAAENIYQHALLHGIPRRRILQNIDKIIGFAEVEIHRDLPLKCFSQGMQARLAFAAAMQVEADLYLFDEVFAVGDAAFNEKCKKRMRWKKKQGHAAIVVLHSLTNLQEVCDRILYFDKGRIVKEERVERGSWAIRGAQSDDAYGIRGPLAPAAISSVSAA